MIQSSFGWSLFRSLRVGQESDSSSRSPDSYLANGTWNAISVFLLRLFCHIGLLSWLPGIFAAPFWLLCLNLQSPTPLSLGRLHLASPR